MVVRIKQNKTSKCFCRKPGPCRASIEYMLVLMMKVVMMFSIYSQSEDFPESFWCGISCHAVFDNRHSWPWFLCYLYYLQNESLFRGITEMCPNTYISFKVNDLWVLKYVYTYVTITTSKIISLSITPRVCLYPFGIPPSLSPPLFLSRQSLTCFLTEFSWGILKHTGVSAFSIWQSISFCFPLKFYYMLNFF